MIYVLAIEKHHASNSDLFSVDSADLSLCPEIASSADFLQTMAGWL